MLRWQPGFIPDCGDELHTRDARGRKLSTGTLPKLSNMVTVACYNYAYLMLLWFLLPLLAATLRILHVFKGFMRHGISV